MEVVYFFGVVFAFVIIGIFGALCNCFFKIKLRTPDLKSYEKIKVAQEAQNLPFDEDRKQRKWHEKIYDKFKQDKSE